MVHSLITAKRLYPGQIVATCCIPSTFRITFYVFLVSKCFSFEYLIYLSFLIPP